MELGGNIELAGFGDLDSSEMIVLKKVIGNYVRKFSDHFGPDYQKMSLHMKPIHGNSKFEVMVKLVTKEHTYNSEVTENNLFVCVADALKKVESQFIK